MFSGVRTQATVQHGGLIQVRSEEMPEGATVEVIILVDAFEPNRASQKGLTRFIGAAPGTFSSVAEIDDYISQERDSWDS